ncbi:MAG: hypothetical protein WCP87_01105 [Atribacterota bacterium]
MLRTARLLLVFLMFFILTGVVFASEDTQVPLAITVESTPVLPDDTITIQFTGASGNSKDWIGLYKSGAPDRDYLEWKYFEEKTTGSMTFNPIKEEGGYEFRAFANDGMTLINKSDPFEVKKITVSVTGWETKSVGVVTLNVPQNWKPSPPDVEITGWYQGEENNPDVAFAVVLKDNLEDQMLEVTIDQESEKVIGSLSFRYVTGSIENGKMKVWLLISRKTVFGGKYIGLVAGCSQKLWPEAEPIFNQILASVKITLPPEIGITLHVPEKPVPPKADFTIEFSGAPGNPKDWIGLYRSNSPDRDHLIWKYTDSQKSGTITFSAPEEEGIYDVRLFENDEMKRLAQSPSFTVKKETLQPSFQLEKENFTPGEEIKVQFTAPDGLSTNAWVGIIPSSTPHGDETVNDQNDLTYQYLSGRTAGQLVFPAPIDPGSYDLRMNDSDSGGKEITSITFTVTNPGPRLSVEPSPVRPGEIFTVSYQNSPGNPKDWIRLYKKISNDRDYVIWKYTEGKKDGSTSFAAPTETGEYDVRLFENDGYTFLAKSDPFLVGKIPTDDQSPQPSPSPSPFPISLDELTSITWEFGRGDGTVLGTLRLLPEGKISGYSNPNESSWGIEGNTLLFYHSSGKSTTRFNSFQKKDGKWIISGPFLLYGKNIHVLKEKK